MAEATIQTSQNGHDPRIDTGAPMPVAVEYVEAQLMELWRDVADVARTQGGVQGVTMNQVLNLIVRADSNSASNSYMEDVDRIISRHPCRVIFMITDPAEEEMPLQAWVSIRCQLPLAGGRQVCCEQVSIAAAGESVRQIPAAVLPTIISDLPAFLWWPQGAPFDDFLFRNLSESLDRLIVDSSTFENPEGMLLTMSDRLKAGPVRTACTDMNWGRLTPWREMVAHFFDGPALRPFLDRVGRVSIDFALSSRGGANRAAALLLAGWLASRLKWEPAEPLYELSRSPDNLPATARLNMRVGSRKIAVVLRPVPARLDVPGEIQSIKLEALGDDPEGEPEAVFVVALSDEQEHCAVTRVNVSGVHPTSRTLQMQPMPRSELLDLELEVFSHDKIYDEALAAAGVFIRGTKQEEAKPAGGPRKLSSGEPISSPARRTIDEGR